MQRILLVSVCVAGAVADTITWTNLIGDGIWSDYRNWSPTKVPGPSDTAIIAPSNQQAVLIDTAAAVDSLIITAGLVRTPNALSAGTTIAVSGTGQLTLDCGQQVVSTAYGNISSSLGVVFASGTLEGTWEIREGSMLNFSGAGQKAFTQAKVTVDGSAAAAGAATFNLVNASSLDFAGTLQLSPPAGSPAVMLGSADSMVSGKLALGTGGQLNVQVPTSLDTVDIASGGFLNIITSTHKMVAITAQGSSTVSMSGGTNMNTTSLSSQGRVQSAGTWVVTGDATIATLAVSAGIFTLQKGGTVTDVTMVAGTFLANGLNADKVSVTQSGTFDGNGQWKVNNLTIGGQQTVLSGPTVSVAKSASLAENLLISGGMLNISSTASAMFDGFKILPQGNRPSGTMVQNDGTITILSDSSFTQVNGAGAGKVVLSKGVTMTVSDSTWYCSEASLASGASITGGNTVWNFGDIASSDNGTVTMVVHKVTVVCPGTCGKLSATDSEISFSAKSS